MLFFVQHKTIETIAILELINEIHSIKSDKVHTKKSTERSVLPQSIKCDEEEEVVVRCSFLLLYYYDDYCVFFLFYLLLLLWYVC